MVASELFGTSAIGRVCLVLVVVVVTCVGGALPWRCSVRSSFTSLHAAGHRLTDAGRVLRTKASALQVRRRCSGRSLVWCVRLLHSAVGQTGYRSYSGPRRGTAWLLRMGGGLSGRLEVAPPCSCTLARAATEPRKGTRRAQIRRVDPTNPSQLLLSARGFSFLRPS